MSKKIRIRFQSGTFHQFKANDQFAEDFMNSYKENGDSGVYLVNDPQEGAVIIGNCRYVELIEIKDIEDE
jgi:hypothetical protein